MDDPSPIFDGKGGVTWQAANGAVLSVDGAPPAVPASPLDMQALSAKVDALAASVTSLEQVVAVPALLRS